MEDIRIYLLAEWQKPKWNESLIVQVWWEMNYKAESLNRRISLASSLTVRKLRYWS